MKIDKSKTVTGTARKVFESLAEGEVFTGLEFKKMCVSKNPKLKNTYEDTFMRILREHYRAHFVCINRQKSKYKKI